MTRLWTSATALLISNVGTAALSFLLSVMIGRFTGNDGLGIYATVLAWTFPLIMVVEFGINTLITRDAGRSSDGGTHLVQQGTRAFLWIGCPLCGLLWIAAPAISTTPAVVIGLRISTPLLLIAPLYGALTAVFRAQHRTWAIPLLSIGMLLVQALGTGVALAASADIQDALVINVLTSAGQLAAAWAIWHWGFRHTVSVSASAHPVPQTPLALMSRAAPFAIAGVLAALQLRSGLLLLEAMTDARQVGLYAAAARFVEAAKLIPNALFGALLPALSPLVGQPQAFEQLFRRTTAGLTAFGAAAGAVLSASAVLLMRWTYGETFLAGGEVLAVLAWSLVPALLRSGRTLYWYALGREQFANRMTAVLIVAQAGLCLMLLPRWGAVGLALVTGLVELMGCLLLWQPRPISKGNAHDAHETP